MKLSSCGFAAIAVLFFMTGTAGAGAADEKSAQPKNAAVVDGHAISYNDFTVQLGLIQRRLQTQGRQVQEEHLSQLRSEVLDDMINRELLFQESRKLGIGRDAAQIEKEVSSIKQRYPDGKQFEAALSEMHMTEAMLKDQLAQRAGIQALVEKQIAPKVSVSDADAKTYYDANPAMFEQPEQVHARHILVKVEEGASEKDKAEAKRKIMDIKKRIDSGADFAKVAEKESDCPSRAKGGDLGYFSKGQMVKPFEEKAFSLKNNEISDVVETRFGYHIIQVLDHKAAGKMDFESVKTGITKKLRDEQIREKLLAHIGELRRKAKIETYIK